MRFATSGILQFFVMSSYCVLRAQCYYTQRSSYTEAISKPTVSPSFDNYFMENGNGLCNVTCFGDLMPNRALLRLLGFSPSFTLHDGF